MLGELERKKRMGGSDYFNGDQKMHRADREDIIMSLRIQVWKIRCCDATNGNMTTKEKQDLKRTWLLFLMY